MIELTNPYALWLLLLIPLLMVIQALASSRWEHQKNGYFHPKTYARIIRQKPVRRKVALVLEYLGLALGILALSGPGIGTEIREVKREGVDIVIALDLSQSMSAVDIKPSRLERAKLEIGKMFSVLKGDRIGLVGFAGVAHLQCPLTLDHRAARMLLDVMDVTLLPVQGSALADAIIVAVNAFPENSDKYKALVVISDGEDHEHHLQEAIALAEKNGVTMYSVGVGTLKGSPIPVYEKGSLKDYKRDKSGKIIITQLHEDVLWQIAEKTGGKYLRLTDVQNPLLNIYSDISEMDKKEFQTHEFGHVKQLYQIFLSLALVAFLIRGFITENEKKDDAAIST
ncbi:MAG: VWA domain-containing protein [Candidatus Marinimicrobia bacterium]|nr:VWA domain-containing protein [Candidatus Neomarinimicrobiota bacterium]